MLLPLAKSTPKSHFDIKKKKKSQLHIQLLIYKAKGNL